MARSKATKLPPSPEAKENALIIIRGTAEPVTASSLTKLLLPPHAISAKELVSILEEFVADGKLVRLPPKTATGKPQYWHQDPATAGRPALLDAVQRAKGPQTIPQLLKGLGIPLSTASAQAILDDFVAQGSLRKFPVQDAPAKTQYWDRDPEELKRIAVHEVLQSAESPLTPQEIAKQCTGLSGVKAADLVPVLESLISSGSVHLFTSSGAKTKPRYWGRPVAEFGRQSIRKYLETKGAQPEAKIRKALKDFDDAHFQQILADGFASKDFFRHPAVGKVKTELIGIRPASPEPYLSDVTAQLAKIVPQLLAANISRDDLRRHLIQVIEAAGIPFAASRSSEPNPHGEAPATGVDLIALIRRLEPGADRGALVGARDLRRAAQLEKATFDNAVLDLARQGRLSLHYHDYPSSLAQAERDELVTDGTGTYYVGVALRQNSQ